MTDKDRIEALRAALLEIPAICTESRRSPDLLAARVRATANAALRADDEAARQGESSPEAREAAREWLASWEPFHLHPLDALLSALEQPPDVQAAIRDELAGGE